MLALCLGEDLADPCGSRAHGKHGIRNPETEPEPDI